MSAREWMNEAHCRNSDDPEMFFSRTKGDSRAALALCDRCVVAAACRDYARAIRAAAGIWGGQERGLRGRPSRPRTRAGRATADEREEMRTRYERKYAKSFARMDAKAKRGAR